jgi:hypothetical protein
MDGLAPLLTIKIKFIKLSQSNPKPGGRGKAMTEAHYRQQGFPHAFMQLPGIVGWGKADSGQKKLAKRKSYASAVKRR